MPEDPKSEGPGSGDAPVAEGPPKSRRGKRGREQPRPRAASDRQPRQNQQNPLTAGLFRNVADQEVPCKIGGCTNTWTWSADQQIRALGEPAPQRMCEEHLARLHQLEDREVECRNPSCNGTWTWKRGTQLAQLQRTESKDPPARLCEPCFQKERNLSEREVECRIDGCSRTWQWTREAQVKHRAWLRRRSAENTPNGDARSAPDPNKPPRRLCEPCSSKLGRLRDTEVSCKVHGCTRTVAIDRESQLRAWLALSDDVEADAPLPKRMCDVCREFVRTHSDRDVGCGRPGCTRTWTYKAGAQLQAFLAGRLRDPIRLCEPCTRGEFGEDGETGEQAPPGSEIMPCVVPRCLGTWIYSPGMSVTSAADGELPRDRMCASCRDSRGAETEPTDP